MLAGSNVPLTVLVPETVAGLTIVVVTVVAVLLVSLLSASVSAGSTTTLLPLFVTVPRPAGVTVTVRVALLP